MTFDQFDSAAMKFFRSHNLDAVLAGEIKVGLGINLAAQSHLQRVPFSISPSSMAYFTGVPCECGLPKYPLQVSPWASSWTNATGPKCR